MELYYIQGIGRREPCSVESLFLFSIVLIFDPVQNETYYHFDPLKASRLWPTLLPKQGVGQGILQFLKGSGS